MTPALKTQEVKPMVHHHHHRPITKTTTSTTTIMEQSSTTKSSKDAALALDKKRQSLEIEAEAILLELKSEEHGKVGMDQPLVDAEGYPRGDIDVYRVRTLRSRWNQIQTDHKEIMEQIESQLLKPTNFTTVSPLVKTTLKEEGLELQARQGPKPKPKFDPKSGKWVVMNWDGSIAGVEDGDKRSFENLEKEEPVVEMDTTTTNDDDEENLIPFAKIDFVAPNSPASQACMEEGDLVLRFGDIDYRNHNNLTALGALVPRLAESNESVEVQVFRQSSKLFLKLSPRPWHGRGLLGCHIVKYEVDE
eukprot:CAMPEP_0194220900 /NCGR_PEP_ID=MMETSP0156-20130528/29488_1 /TAXON_ID=33649 /ORGANISM="Thalassionema nitzschioides, Strain L26-B" /LENGTH=304 /DNA_ID=CAMNT_0038951129 /DNA_START=40 /DNA_END=954 /DNA_ORIENTATION=-